MRCSGLLKGDRNCPCHSSRPLQGTAGKQLSSPRSPVRCCALQWRRGKIHHISRSSSHQWSSFLVQTFAFQGLGIVVGMVYFRLIQGAQRTSSVQWNHWTFSWRVNNAKAEVPKELYENSRRKNTCKIPEINHRCDKVPEGKTVLQLPATPPAKLFTFIPLSRKLPLKIPQSYWMYRLLKKKELLQKIISELQNMILRINICSL